MARLENAILTLVEVFNEYADKGNITMDDFKTMLEEEIACKEVKEQISDEALEEALGELDRNQDGMINIREFTLGVGFLIKCIYHVQKKLDM
ncbi:S100 calcium binding protein W [Labrus bergylta]|uniref:EF-hand domain-containing protein n=1 Tax=Labrus bergylta TaxID=56723 RepID=A0A3Q3EMC0_9LABR